METYHLRRKDKEISSQAEMDEILASQKFMTIAMCKDGEPYLVSLNYGYEPTARVFHFHCAEVGKKLDFLKANPKVWGQVVEDRGYLRGECDHAYRCVMFSGKAEFAEGAEAKRKSLQEMFRQAEGAPDSGRLASMDEKSLAEVTVGRIAVETMTGKKGPIKRAKT